MQRIATSFHRSARIGRSLLRDGSGLAAVEFAIILPLMLVMFFGTVEFSSGIAVDRKVTLVARTLSDLISQTDKSVDDNAVKNAFAASSSVLTPFDVAPVRPTISEIYIDTNKIAKIQWTKSATVAMSSGSPQVTLQASGHNVGDVVATIPPTLLIPKTFLIWSEVDYRYTPAVGYVMGKTGVNLHDESYTRPRYSSCVDYPAPAPPTAPCTSK
jgi:Flp pilus assembly protein TadG